MLEFAKRDEVLDVYHALEHLSDCGKILYGAETKEYDTWQDETTLELLWNGYELIEKRLDKLDAEYKTAEEQTAEEQTAEEQTARKLAELEAIRKLRGYLSYHAERLNYRERLAEWRSIGSDQLVMPPA